MESKNPQNPFLSTHSKLSESTAKEPNQNVFLPINLSSRSLSFFPVPADIVETNPHEFLRLIQEPEMCHLIQLRFAQAPQSLMFMRHYHFLSDGIRHLQSDLNRHKGEQNTIFNIMNGNQSYQITISPIITKYHCMRQ